MKHLSKLYAVALLAGTIPLSGCLFRSHKVAQQPVTSAILRNATKQELIALINQNASKIKTLNATVDIAASSGGVRKGKVTDYQEIRGYILLREPGMLRMIGLFPVVRNRAFDMVSNGKEFKLSIPPKNRFVVGHNDLIRPSTTQPLENLRPQHIYDALLIHAIDPQSEIAVMETGQRTVTDPKNKKPVLNPTYVLDVIRRDTKTNDWFLSRKVIFDRTDLRPVGQLLYDASGNLVTDAQYQNFQDYQGVQFPSVIVINRPQEEYSITLKMVKLEINKPLSDEQFALQQPPGSKLVNLDEPQAAQAEQGQQVRAQDGSPK